MRLHQLYFLGIIFLLMGCSSNSTLDPVNKSILPDLGPAPELTNQTWLNSNVPLRLADLEGKVVLIDMWTFG